MTSLQPRCLPTAIGSLPLVDPEEACDLLLGHLTDIPMWPQLPKRSPLESMYVQYFAKLPGAAVEGDRVFVDPGVRLQFELEQLYADYLAGDTTRYDLSPAYAAGWAAMLRRWQRLRTPPYAVKGHITGPISSGIQITDRALRPILYDEVLADALAKYLSLVAGEQERHLQSVCERTIVFLDEPYLNAVGSAFISMARDQVVRLLGEVMSGLQGSKAIHCCGNTDWGLVLSTPIDVLSFDAYNYAETVALYAADVKSFLRRGGVLAWGIVPNDEALLANESADSLIARLLGGISLLVEKGLDQEEIAVSSIITPACGMGTLSPVAARRALDLTVQVSHKVRASFFGGRC